MLSLEASQKWDLSVTKCYWTSLSSIRRRTRVYSHRCALHEIGVTSWDRQGQGCHSAQPRRKGPIGTLVISARILWSAAAGRINPLQWYWGGAGWEQQVEGPAGVGQVAEHESPACPGREGDQHWALMSRNTASRLREQIFSPSTWHLLDTLGHL